MSIFKNFKNKVKTLQTTTEPKPTMWSDISSFEASKPSIFNQERSMYKRGGYAHGGKPKSGKADIFTLEKSCSYKKK